MLDLRPKETCETARTPRAQSSVSYETRAFPAHGSNAVPWVSLGSLAFLRVPQVSLRFLGVPRGSLWFFSAPRDSLGQGHSIQGLFWSDMKQGFGYWWFLRVTQVSLSFRANVLSAMRLWGDRGRVFSALEPM